MMTSAMAAAVVGDNHHVVAEISRWLCEFGYVVHRAYDFEGGRSLLSRRALRLLIVDVRLGQFNGTQLLLLARATAPTAATIVMSRWNDPLIRGDIESFDGEYVQKPLTRVGLYEAVVRAHDRINQRAHALGDNREPLALAWPKPE